ncbi:MAG: hypothetical protein ABI685_09385 [Ferruginibacter sp.]
MRNRLSADNYLSKVPAHFITILTQLWILFTFFTGCLPVFGIMYKLGKRLSLK